MNKKLIWSRGHIIWKVWLPASAKNLALDGSPSSDKKWLKPYQKAELARMATDMESLRLKTPTTNFCVTILSDLNCSWIFLFIFSVAFPDCKFPVSQHSLSSDIYTQLWYEVFNRALIQLLFTGCLAQLATEGGCPGSNPLTDSCPFNSEASCDRDRDCPGKQLCCGCPRECRDPRGPALPQVGKWVYVTWKQKLIHTQLNSNQADTKQREITIRGITYRL